jgi:hypothetical protein
MKKTLKSVLCGTLILTLTNFLSIKEANGQEAIMHRLAMKEADKEMTMAQPIYPQKLKMLYLGIQPTDLGISVGYSRDITNRLGAYSFLSKGTYTAPANFLSDDFKKSTVKHYKISMGGILYTTIDSHGKAFIIAGPTYSFNDKKNYISKSINEKAFRKLSFEFGAGAVIGSFGGGFLFDALKGESNVFMNFAF